MKKLLLLTIPIVIGLTASAQTQQGYVKTKGRMVNGKLVPGQGLKGATVSIKGRTAVLVNAEDGAFSFPVTESMFRVDSVRKKGYQLVDMDAMGKSYKPSPNPLYIVMETPEQQLQDKLNAERKIRRNLQKQLQDKEDEIEALKEENKITLEEYQKSLQKLYQDQENNEQLIADMAKRYSELDYDQLDEFYRQVSYYIENGELVKADSLLNTRGDLSKQVEEQLQKGQAIKAQEEQLGKAKAVHAADQEELARRCYSYYETFAAQHMNDTAAYYLELRASLDTTNVDWLNEAGEFISQYIADYNKAQVYFQKGLNLSIAKSGEQSESSGYQYYCIGTIYYYLGDYEKALEFHNKALSIWKKVFGEEHPDVANSYHGVGADYYAMGDYEKALEFQNKALSIRKKVFGEEHPDVARSYHEIGADYYAMGDYEKALEFNNKALSIRKKVFGEEHPDVANSYHGIGTDYYAMGDYKKALEFHNKPLSIWKKTVGEEHPNVATSYHQLGKVYTQKGDYPKALEYLQKALNIRLKNYGEIHFEVAASYFYIGSVYEQLGDIAKAIEYYEKAVRIDEQALGIDHPYTIEDKATLEAAKAKMKEQENETKE